MSFSQLRPLSLGEILDGAFTLYRRHFPTLVLTALIPTVPIILLWIAIGAGALGGTDAAFVMAGGAALLLLPLTLVASVVAWGALTHFLARAYTGTPVTAKESLNRALGRFFPLLGGMIAVGFMAMLGALACIVPAFFVMVGSFAFVAAIVLERRGPVEAVQRSFELVKGGWGETFLVLFVVYLIAAMPGMAVGVLSAVGNVVAMQRGPETGMMVQALSQVIAQLVNALTTPFSVAATVLLYYDRRVRTEALDVQMMAEALAGPGPGGPAPSAGWG